MYITLGKKEYELESSAMTLIKYRARYGESFLYLFLKHVKISELIPAWERLIYIAIIGAKPRFNVYQELIRKDMTGFLTAAAEFQHELMRCPGGGINYKKSQRSANDIDELQILALCTDLPEYAVSMFCIFDLLKLISQSKGFMSAKKKYRKMTADEIRKLYGG